MLNLIRRQLAKELDQSIFKKQSFTLDRTMMIKEILEEMQYKVKYMNSEIHIVARGNNAPDKGNYTLNNFVCWHNGNSFRLGIDEYKGGLQTPDSFINSKGVIEGNTGFEIIDGILNNKDSSSCSGGSGTVIEVIEIPFNILTLDFDDTLMEE